MADSGTLLFGYFREHLLMTPADKNRIHQRFARYAQAHGYHLGKIFMEEVETAPAAFHKLVAATYLDKPALIVTPSRIHLSVISLDWQQIWSDFVAQAGTELKVLPPPFDHGPAPRIALRIAAPAAPPGHGRGSEAHLARSCPTAGVWMSRPRAAVRTPFHSWPHRGSVESSQGSSP